MSYNILQKLKLKEISAVDRPAQQHATMVLMKRADDEPKTEQELPAMAEKPVDKKETVEVVKSVVYKSVEGAEYYNTDDTRLVDLAKQRDADQEQLTIAKAKVVSMEYAKRAETELEHLPGEVTVKAELLKAIDAISDEAVRTAALAIVKANNSEMAVAFVEKGTAEKADDSDAGAQLDTLAKKYQDENSCSFAQAYDAVLKTVDGKKLYEQAI